MGKAGQSPMFEEEAFAKSLIADKKESMRR